MSEPTKDHAQSFFNGVINLMNDIRHKVVEELWFSWGNGRTVTEDIPEKGNSPQTNHAACLNTEPEINWRSRVNESSDIYGQDNALKPVHEIGL